MVRNVDLTWQLWDMMQRDTALLKPTENPPLPGCPCSEESLMRNVPPPVSVLLCCGYLLGGRSQLSLVTLLCHPAGTAWALRADWSWSPDHLHFRVNLALRWSCALKQSPQTKPFLWSFSVTWFVKIVYGSLLPIHCCSYLKTYLDGILQSLLKFAWITLLIFYCSTWIKWQAEMLIRLKFPSAMQVPLMFQLALEWNKITSTVLVFISLNKQEKFSRINSLNCTFRVHFINLQR